MVEKKSLDGGFSQTLTFDPAYEADFVAIRGLEQWTAYRREWEEYSRLEREADHPPHLELELNYSCNLKCPMCTWAVETAMERKADWFKFEDYTRLVDEAVSIGTKSIRFCYINEPLIRTDIDQFIRYASGAGLIDLLLTTNGTLMTREVSRRLIDAGLTKLNVSLDAFTEETYGKIRVGGNLARTTRNILDFLEVRAEMQRTIPKVRLTFVMTKINHHEYDAFLEYWRDKVDSIGIQHLQNPFGEGRFRDPARGEALILKKAEAPSTFRCAEPFKRLVLRSNGDVLPCCSFYAVDLVVGNWREQRLADIWNSTAMTELRADHKAGDYSRHPVCASCIQNYTIFPD